MTGEKKTGAPPANLRGRAAGRSASDLADLEHIGTIVDSARAAWPMVSTPAEVFLSYVAERLPAELEIGPALARMRTDELYLACACAHGDTEAMAAFERGYLREVDVMLKRLDVAGPIVEDVKQILRERLLVGDVEGCPRIRGFTGAGSLYNWLRIAAVREALLILRRGRREVATPDETLSALSMPTGDPELEFIKSRYRGEFREAFLQGLAQLSRRQRNVLRHYLVYDLGIDQIGAIYHVHRATAARWIGKAQELLLVEIKRHLMTRLEMSRSECESMVRVLRSQLDVTLRRCLGRGGEVAD